MAEGFLPPVVARLVADIHEFQGKMAEARGEMAATTASGGASFEKLAAVGRTAFLAIGAAGIAVGVASIHLADQFEESHARLQNAIHNSGVSWASWAPTVDRADKALENWGFTHTETENALSRLVPVTTSSNQALTLQALAADVARARHMDLEQATQVLVKVQTGHVALLGRLGINTKDATGATISQEEALRRLTEMYGGSAQRQSETFAGKMKTLEAQVSDLGVKIGQFLIPIVEEVVGVLVDGAEWLERNRTVAYALAGVIGGFLVTAMSAFVALKVAGAIKNISEAFSGVVGMVGRVVEFFVASEAGAAADAVAQGTDAAAAAANGTAHELAAGQMALFGTAAETSGAGAAAGAGGIGGLGAVALAAALPIGMAAFALTHLGRQGSDVDLTLGQLATGSVTQLSGAFAELGKAGQQHLVEMFRQANPGLRDEVHNFEDLQRVVRETPGTFAEFGHQIESLAVKQGALAGETSALGKKSVELASNFINAAVAAGVPTKTIGEMSAALDTARLRHDDVAAASQRLAYFQGLGAGTLTQYGAAVIDANGKVLGYATSFGFIPAAKQTNLNADHSNAMAHIADVRAGLASIPEWKIVQLSVQAPNNVRMTAFGPMVNVGFGWFPIQAHALGGIFDKAHVGLVAESGREAVLPLDDPARSWQLIAESGLLGSGGASSSPGGATGSGGDTYNAYITVTVPLGAHPDEVASEINDILAGMARRGGAMAWNMAQSGRSG